MDKLFNFILFLILVDKKCAVLEPCKDFCSLISEPFEPFRTFSNGIKKIFLDDRLRSVICPPSELKHVLFDCSSMDACHCNLSLEVYKQCFGDNSFCDVLANSVNSSFAHKCNKVLENVCSGYTFPTLRSTIAPLTSARTTKLPQLPANDTSGNSSRTPTRKPLPETPIYNSSITDSSSESDEANTKTAITTVFALGIIGVAIATLGIFLYKKSRQRTRELNVNNQEQPRPLLAPKEEIRPINGCATFHKYETDCQKSCDSGVVCNVEINTNEAL